MGANIRNQNIILMENLLDVIDNPLRLHREGIIRCVAVVLRLDITREDLQPFAGKLGFALLGFCSDLGVVKNKGRAGAAHGPESIRRELANLPCSFQEEVKIFDAGDIHCENISLEQGQAQLAQAVERILELNLFPIVLGGGHEVALGHYRGIASHLSPSPEKAKIGIINFDAHFDIRPYADGGNSGTMFRQIYDDCKSSGDSYAYLCLGIQQHCNTIELFKTAKSMGVEYLLAKEMQHSNALATVSRIDDFIKHQDKIYLTICADVLSTAFAPGVSASQTLGLDPEHVLLLLEFILRSQKVVSFDVAEVSPRFDLDDATANLAAVLIFALVNAKTHIEGLAVEF